MPSGYRKALGRRGEDLACGHLEGLGFTIVERNYRTARGEIDIVAGKAGLTVFVEVKARRSRLYGEPEEAVTPSKVRRLRSLAAEYLARKGGSGEVRFDVISVTLDGDGNTTGLRHLPGAF